MSERAAGDVGEHLLDDRVVAVLSLCPNGESVKTAWQRQAGNSSSCPAPAFLFTK